MAQARETRYIPGNTFETMYSEERQQKMDRVVKMGLASLLLVMILALGGLALTSPALDGGISALLARATDTGQGIDANAAPAVQVKSSNGATATTGQSSSTSTQNAQAQSGLVDARPAVRKVGPAVVTVVNKLQANGSRSFGGGFGQVSPEALGSGVIIDTQGHIVTNQHVVAGQQSLEVIFADGTS